MDNRYHSLTRWRVRGAIEEVYELVTDALDYPRWWPSVYLRVEQLDTGNALGTGRRVRLFTKGWLHYTLCWDSEVVRAEPPGCLEIRASGDFEGHGTWNLRQNGTFVDATFDWNVKAAKPLLRLLSPLLKPVFEANHRWAMDQGKLSLKLELQRRHSNKSAEQMKVPEPPGPSRTSGLLLAGSAMAVLGVLWLMRKRSR